MNGADMSSETPKDYFKSYEDLDVSYCHISDPLFQFNSFFNEQSYKLAVIFLVFSMELCYDQVHHVMLNDQPRTEAYRHAISANKAMFKDKVVIDVGAGTGL